MSDFDQADTANYPAVPDLEKFFAPSARPARVTFGGLSHPGRIRANNEDHFLVVQRRRTRSILLTNLSEGAITPGEDTAYVMAVADGIGGAAFGELASSLALRDAFDLGHDAAKWIFKVNDQEAHELQQQIEAILKLTHRSLVERAREDRSLAGMGTTLTGAYTIGFDAFVAHIGDSRAYLHREGSLTRLTRDHTVAQDMLDLGVEPEPGVHHVLTNCLGGSKDDVKVDFHHYRLQHGDRLLLCTDGLSDMVPDHEIARILATHADPTAASQALVDLALDHGGRDNVTVVLADYQRQPGE